MPPRASNIVSACTFTVGCLAAWFGTTVLPTKLLWYLPQARQFTFEVHPVGVGADFYGRLLWSCAAGIAAAGLGYRYARRRPAETLGPMVRVLWVWGLSLLLLNAGLYAFTLAHREPVPLPLPPRDDPR